MATLKSIKNKYLAASDGAILGVPTNTENISTLAFKLATADNLSKFNLVDGFSDDFNDSTGVDASTSSNENRNTTGKYWSGSSTTYSAFSYTGSDQTWTAPSGFSSVTVRLWGAGGGSRGSNIGGGGGFVKGTLSVTAGNDYDVIVGQGGGINGAADAYGGGGRGGPNAATGGGRTAIRTDGGNADLVTAGSGGGSGTTGNGGGGGGTTGKVGTGYLSNGGGGTQSAGGSSHGSAAGQYFGGDAYPHGSLSNSGGGGSGWYGGGSGGNRNDVHFGGGGGGSSYVTGLSATEDNLQGETGDGSPAGQGAGQGDSQWVAGVGNGGPSSTQVGEPGRVVFAWDSFQNMTLVSNSYTAQADPTTVRIILDEATPIGTTTVNTDIKAYASRDNGTTFTQITNLASQGDLITAPGGIDVYTKLMLHCDGANDGTTFTDSSSEGGNTAHTVTANADVHTDTAVKKFGTASAQFDGTGDYLSAPDSADWDLAINSDSYTIDFWCYFSSQSGDRCLVEQYEDGNNYWALICNSTTGFRFQVHSGGSEVVTTGTMGVAVPNTTWMHIAMVKNANIYTIYKDGVATAATVDDSSNDSFSGLLRAGLHGDGSMSYHGYIDELRLSKGVARWTANFTSPASPYFPGEAADFNRRLLSGSLDVSGQPAGSNMKYKIETLNQTSTKTTRVYAASMAWS